MGWGQVAAAQLAVLDEAIDGLQQAIADREDADEWSWMFCSLGGIPLGEHGSLGLPQQVGYSEEVAAAAMVRPANSIPIGSRRGELCQLPDITATLHGGNESVTCGLTDLGSQPAASCATELHERLVTAVELGMG